MKKGLKSRQKGALERLQTQLKSGVKPVKKEFGKTEPLTDSDKKRINREIENLENALKKS